MTILCTSPNQLSLLLLIFRAAPTAYGCSQARGRIRATAAGLHHRHRNTGSLTHWTRPGIKPTSSWILVGFVSAEPWRELPNQYFPVLYLYYTLLPCLSFIIFSYMFFSMFILISVSFYCLNFFPLPHLCAIFSALTYTHTDTHRHTHTHTHTRPHKLYTTKKLHSRSYPSSCWWTFPYGLYFFTFLFIYFLSFCLF